MTDEELRIGVKVEIEDGDTNSKVLNKATGEAKKLAEGYNQGASGASKMSAETQEMVKAIKTLTHIDIGGLLIKGGTIEKFKELGKAINNLKPPMSELKKNLKDAQTVASSAKLAYNDAKSADHKQQRALGKSILNYKGTTGNVGQIVKNAFKKQQTSQVKTAAQQQLDQSKEAVNASKAAVAERRAAIRDMRKQQWSTLWRGTPITEEVPTGKFKQGRDAKGHFTGEKIPITETKTVGYEGGIKALATAGLIGLAVTAILKTIQKIKKTIQEITNLWKTSIQKNISTQAQQQYQYLQDYLGYSEDQIQTLLEEQNETTQELLEKQYKLGGVATEDQTKAIKELSQATTDLKTAWSGLWTTISATFAPLIEDLVVGITWIIAAINYAFSDAAAAGDNLAEDLHNALEDSYYIKKNLMGFDELNILSANTSLIADESEDKTAAQQEREEITEEYQAKQEENKEARQEAEEQITTSKTGGEVVQGIVDWLDGLMQSVIDGWHEVLDKFDTTKIYKILDLSTIGVFGTAIGILENLAALILKFVDRVLEIIGDIALALTGAVELIVGFFKGLFTGDWDLALTGLKDLGKGIANIFIDVLNVIIDALNTAVTMLGEIGIGNLKLKNIKGFDKIQIPNVPRLATGGVITQPTVGLMGEYAGAHSNPEIVAPQSVMYETVRNANGDIIDANIQLTRQIIAAISEKDLSVKIGDKDVCEATNRYNNQFRRMTGKSLLQV